MNPILRNILAVVFGIIIGSVVNMAIVMASGYVIPPPEGADLTTPEGLKAAIPLMQPKHFLLPFLAHALGTLAGAFIAAKVAATHRLRLALVVGICFLVGGIMMVVQYPQTPIWFMIVDLGLAYIPMAYLGAKLAIGKQF